VDAEGKAPDAVASGPLRRLAASLLALARIRLELLALEVHEEKERLVGMLVWAVVTAFLGCFAVVFLALFITVALWDTHRLAALGVGMVLIAGLALWGGLQLRRLTRAGSTLFQSSIAELREDSRALDPTRRP
jgi:uncharacterized membrane protein YqjE